jgi:uncharacterized protein (DUF1684 family)
MSLRKCARVWSSIALACVLSAACTSGPGPADTRSYESQILEWRTSKDVAFKSTSDDSFSPIPKEQRASFQGLSYYPVDTGYRAPAALTVERSNPPIIIELQTSGAELDRYRKVGTLGFTIGSVQYKLTAFAEERASLDRLFVPFGDLTNGGETYKGGRFLELDRTPTGFYDLDFNRAYHPFCVFNPSYICPVPPRENRLPVAIRAGERLAAPH